MKKTVPFILPGLLLKAVIITSCAGTPANGPTHLSKAADTIITVGQGPASVEIADLNNDSYSDIAVANVLDGTVTILLNNGKGVFTSAAGSPFFTDSLPNDIAIADLNNDHNLDLAFPNNDTKKLTILSGNGKGQFQLFPSSPVRVNSKPHAHGIAAADFNKDGNIDLITETWRVDSVIVVFGDGKGSFHSPAAFKVGKRPYQRLRAGDVNGDGNPDIITTNLEGNNLTVLLGNGKGEFDEAEGSPFYCGDAPFGVAIGDVNGDRNADLVIADSPTITAESKGKDGMFVLLGNGTGQFRPMPGSPFETGKSPSRLAIGDIDGNGIADIGVVNYNSRSITVYLMEKEKIKTVKMLDAGEHPDGIAIMDFDNDKKAEIVVANGDDNTIRIYNGSSF